MLENVTMFLCQGHSSTETRPDQQSHHRASSSSSCRCGFAFFLSFVAAKDAKISIAMALLTPNLNFNLSGQRPRSKVVKSMFNH